MNDIQSRLALKLSDSKRVEFERFVYLYDRAEYAHLPRLALREWLHARLGLRISERHFRRVMNATAT